MMQMSENALVINVFNLKKTLLYLYQDSSITESLIDTFYDFIRSKGNITYFSFNDNDKSIILTTDICIPLLDNLIKEWFSNFIVTILRNPSLQYLLQKDMYYNNYLNIVDDDIIKGIAKFCITVLNISPMTSNTMTLKINFID